MNWGPVCSFLRLLARASENRLNKFLSAPGSHQERLLKDLVGKGSSTAFGREHGMTEVLSYTDFKKKIPLRDYPAIKLWWDKVATGETSITWPGVTDDFAETSGSSGVPKRIPLPGDLLKSFGKISWQSSLSYISDGGDPRTLLGSTLFLAPPSPFGKTEAGIPIDWVGTAVLRRSPKWVQKRFFPRPGKENGTTPPVQDATGQDIRQSSGSTPSQLMFMEELYKAYGCTEKKGLTELWSNYKLFNHCGVALEPYQDRIRKVTGTNVEIRETWSASEAPLAFRRQRGDTGLAPVLSEVFFELVESGSDEPERLMLHEGKAGGEYELAVTTKGGAWAYRIGDRIRINSLNPLLVEFAGRVEESVNLAIEKVTAEEVDKALALACRDLGVELVDYTLGPDWGPPVRHELAVEISGAIDSHELSRAFDRRLMEINRIYSIQRGGPIAEPLIRLAPGGAFSRFTRQGAHKVVHVANDRIFLERFVTFTENGK